MKLTPMMQQFFAAKEKHPDAILFFRMGDFYEMFFEDAEVVSRELGLTLTARNKKGDAQKTPMAGVPHHAANGYINRLVEKGFTVAICEQLEDPSVAKGIVKRDVVRVVTPGMVFDTDTLDAKSANYVASVYTDRDRHGIAYVDISTGEFRATEVVGKAALHAEIHRAEPREVVCNDEKIGTDLTDRFANTFSRVRDLASFDPDAVEAKITAGVRLADDIEHDGFFLSSIRPILEGLGGNLSHACAGLLDYMVETQRGVPAHIDRPNVYHHDAFLVLDDATKQNLELTETLMGGHKIGSLLHTIDHTSTALGGRLLRRWISFPLVDEVEINGRLDAVDQLVQRPEIRLVVREQLDDVYDLERLCGKVSSGSCNARDLRSLVKTYRALPQLLSSLAQLESPYLVQVVGDVELLDTLFERIDRALVDEPPTSLKEGGIFARGFSDDLDRVLELAENGKDWILNYEAQEREATGIGNLKVRFNKVFGYFIEVTKSNVPNVPERYIRKQTLTNAERYFTESLKEMETSIIGASENRCSMEYSLFETLRNEVAQQIPSMLKTSQAIAQIDVLTAFAELAQKFDYTRPEISTDLRTDIADGRHPVVERTLKGERFVPNDTLLEPTCALQIITGPNMAGKSTIIRQVALITLMAQMGSFVPASRATIGIVDKIFSRVGASDNLARGHSTFMVEMTETAHILTNATRHSLIILDEIGRGTSTFDGLSIAWAVAEHLHDTIGARTMFATHYHELTELIRTLDRAENMSVAVKEFNDDIVFLRKLVKGQANRSYGIQVGRLAGLPEPVVERAKQVLANLETGQFDDMGIPVVAAGRDAGPTRHYNPNQLSLFNAGSMSSTQIEVLEEIAQTNPDLLTPLEALGLIATWHKQLDSDS